MWLFVVLNFVVFFSITVLFYVLILEVFVCFVNIGGIVDHHCLHFHVIIIMISVRQ
jgi:hypothetical protein